MSKKRPDYTKFMRKPSPLQLSPPSRDWDDMPGCEPDVKEEDIPWAEIIVESEHVADLERAGGVRSPENKPRNARVIPDPGTQARSAIAPPVGFNRPVVITDSLLDYTAHEDLSPQMPLFTAGLPIAAAPPIAALVAVALVVIFLLLQ